MSVQARIVDGPLDPQAPEASPGSGAVLRFEGVVRPVEPQGPGGAPRELAALHYETYDPMAERSLAALATEMLARHRVHAIRVLHSRGRVSAGAISFTLEVRAAHRAEAIAALTEFIDRMKRDVPIWKRPVWR
ncbi:MAG: molybdenum cofactor biosynthesis protein MoaE [Planctomycetes bacterium]|nr:molybdenum cofactor biosynthesis protein MoaE [Planctomycetota bacterium]